MSTQKGFKVFKLYEYCRKYFDFKQNVVYY